MKVAFNARLLYGQSLRGWNRYTLNLIRHLPQLGVEPLLYTDRPLHPDHLAQLPADRFPVRCSPPMRYLRWEQRWLPAQCAKDGIDVLHCPMNFGLPWRSPCPRVLTLHDAIDQVYAAPRQSMAAKFKPAAWRSAFFHWVSRRSADRIITVSEHAKTDLIRHLRLPPEKIAVTYEGADSKFHEPITDDARRRAAAKYELRRPYVFYIGGWEQRKNLPFLLRAFAAAGIPEVDLVLAGGQDDQRASLQDLAQSLGIAPQLRLLGWVDDADLPSLYADALCFVYPSEYEGFGLQLCEAMAAGCPIFAADATSLPEVLGDGGELFTLADPAALAGLFNRVATDQSFREALQRRARHRSTRFSWEQTAQQTAQVYRDLLPTLP